MGKLQQFDSMLVLTAKLDCDSHMFSCVLLFQQNGHTNRIFLVGVRLTLSKSLESISKSGLAVVDAIFLQGKTFGAVRKQSKTVECVFLQFNADGHCHFVWELLFVP